MRIRGPIRGPLFLVAVIVATVLAMVYAPWLLIAVLTMIGLTGLTVFVAVMWSSHRTEQANRRNDRELRPPRHRRPPAGDAADWVGNWETYARTYDRERGREHV